jgi:hypothetical protein
VLPNEPRTVKPRKPSGQPWLPIIALDREGRSAFCELTGTIHGWAELPLLFRSHPSAVVVGAGAAHLIAELDEHYGADPMWQYRVTPVKRERANHDPTRTRRVTYDTLVNYFGWKGTSYTTRTGKRANRRGHWHYPLDPTLFCNTPMRDLVGGVTARDLLDWGIDVRQWCHANGLHPSPTAGGLGGQLLRDPRWYPHARRKVPRATNARARSVLPGNYYKLFIDEHTPVDATYVDMSSSHHHAAAQVAFPCANTLYARGDFRTTDTTETPVPANTLWSPSGTRRFNRMLQSYGLLRVQLNVPAMRADRFPPPYMEQAGRRRVYIYTNEVPLIQQLGGEIEGIQAAWTSYDRDTGLNDYAAWAVAETATMSSRRKRWAKVALLATYGNLAARARTTEFAYRQADSGVPREYPAGPLILPATAHVSDIEREVPTVNVIHRGMIEAEQRRLVLDLARTLHDHGLHVVSIYADAVMVESGRALPLLPAPWRVDAHLSRLRFAAPNTFTSAERTRLPGIAREDADRWRRIAHIRRRT